MVEDINWFRNGRKWKSTKFKVKLNSKLFANINREPNLWLSYGILFQNDKFHKV